MIVHHIANPIPRHCSSVDAVDVGCSELRILSKQVVNGLHDFCKTSGGILKLEQFFDAEELTTFEDRFFLISPSERCLRTLAMPPRKPVKGTRKQKNKRKVGQKVQRLTFFRKFAVQSPKLNHYEHKRQTTNSQGTPFHR
jgi:hypothetical protein